MWIRRNAERTLIHTLADSKTTTNKVLVSSECGALTSALTPSLESKNRTSAIQWDKARERINDTTACEQHFFFSARTFTRLAYHLRVVATKTRYEPTKFFHIKWILIRVHTHDGKKIMRKIWRYKILLQWKLTCVLVAVIFFHSSVQYFEITKWKHDKNRKCKTARRPVSMRHNWRL